MPAPNTAAEIGREGLLELAARVEAAAGADRELDCLIAVAVNAGSLEGAYKAMSDSDDVIRAGYVQHHFNGAKSLQEAGRYTASLDAAMTLVPEGWNWMAGNRNQPLARAYVENGEPAFEGVGTRNNPRRQWFEVVAVTPALALTAAALKARAVGEGE